MLPAAEDQERRLFQLETLYEIGRECAHVATLSDVLHVILSMVMGAFGAVSGMAFVGEATTGRLEALHAHGAPDGAGGAAAALAAAYFREDPASWLRAAALRVCLPIALDGAIGGAIALGARLTGDPYADDELALLRTIVANATPYLQKVRLLQELRETADALAHKVEVLAALNEIALGVAGRPTARRLHHFLVDAAVTTLHAAEGGLALAEAGGWTVAAQSPGDATPVALPPVEALAQSAAAPAHPAGHGGHDLATPVRYGGELVGALWLRRAVAAAPFDADDRALLEFLANQTAIMLENSRLFENFLVQQQEQFRLRGMLEQYLAPAVAQRLISGDTLPVLAGTRMTVTVLMVDMRASTELITHLEPDVMVSLLNRYLGGMTNVLFAYEGTIDKFVGDGVMGFFGAPEAHDDDPLRAVRAAAAMQRAFAALLAEWRQQYSLPASLGTGIGVGIATGEVVVGNIGSAKRLEHTVLGPTVNLAARLTARAPAGSIYLDGATWEAVAGTLRQHVRPRRPRHIRAKGFAALVPVYRLSAGDLPPGVHLP